MFEKKNCFYLSAGVQLEMKKIISRRLGLAGDFEKRAIYLSTGNQIKGNEENYFAPEYPNLKPDFHWKNVSTYRLVSN